MTAHAEVIRVEVPSTVQRLLLGLIGTGIQASRSPLMHEREAAAHGVHCLYQRLDLDRIPGHAEALPQLLEAAERVGFAGLNITHPCKQSVMAHLTGLSEDASGVGAVNTVVFRDGGREGTTPTGGQIGRAHV